MVDEQDVLNEAVDLDGEAHPRDRLHAFEEHGGWFVECLDCGRQWSAHDAATETGRDFLDFEVVSEGDGHCLEK
jgi:hypothetical protein